MKHNKKRNTAFLYECLIKELTKAIVREDKKRQKITKNILSEFFGRNSELKKELKLYNSLLDSKSLNESFSRRLLEETKKDFYGLNRKKIFISHLVKFLCYIFNIILNKYIIVVIT